MGRYLVVLFIFGCSTTFTSKPCTEDSDCGSDVCELREGSAACVDPASATIMLGQSAPFSGVNAALGTDMNNGILLAINDQNAKGGIRGRMLAVSALDDGYDPVQAQTNAMMLTGAVDTGATPTNCPNTATAVSNGATPAQLIPVSTTALDRGSDGVLALIGSVGTPTAVRATPVATETHTLFYGAFTGATSPLRDTTAGTCQKYVFNVRASYAQEAVATIEYFQSLNVPVTTAIAGNGPAAYANLISFDQNDSFGNAGYNGLVAAWEALNGSGAFPGVPAWWSSPVYDGSASEPIARFRYTRNDDNSVPQQAANAETYIDQLLGSGSGSASLAVGVLMTDTYGAGEAFIKALRMWQYGADQTHNQATRLTLDFSNISFVGADALANALAEDGMVPGTSTPYTQNVLVSEVVPNYETTNATIVQNYLNLAKAANQAPTFTALEGYIATNIFIQGLLNAKGPITPDTMIPALEGLPNLSLGLGATAGFSSSNHQYLDSVWGTTLNPDGTFKDTYYWTVDTSSAPLGNYMPFE
ncbi:MAG TPA: ABC transporter substrate-binding protein [Kofleriaceae bacterium]|jgi:ABC-type branched-subunit amino acid transport system substrate-binding protein